MSRPVLPLYFDSGCLWLDEIPPGTLGVCLLIPEAGGGYAVLVDFCARVALALKADCQRYEREQRRLRRLLDGASGTP